MEDVLKEVVHGVFDRVAGCKLQHSRPIAPIEFGKGRRSEIGKQFRRIAEVPLDRHDFHGVERCRKQCGYEGRSDRYGSGVPPLVMFLLVAASDGVTPRRLCDVFNPAHCVG